MTRIWLTSAGLKERWRMKTWRHSQWLEAGIMFLFCSSGVKPERRTIPIIRLLAKRRRLAGKAKARPLAWVVWRTMGADDLEDDVES